MDQLNATCESQFIYYEEPEANPSYVTVWGLEKGFSLNAWRKWFQDFWSFSLILSGIYLFGIYFGRSYMKNRPPMQLRKPLTVWNIGLAIFSIVGFFRTGAELYYILGKENGLHASICLRDDHNVAAACWGCLFVLSKALELGDTAFIVLRKQNLLFLHWYHHLTVLCYTWSTFEENPITSRWFGVMNYGVHSVMYTYYALKSLKIHVSRNIAMLITALQLAQMVVGILINVYAAHIKYQGIHCFVEDSHIQLALAMYGSYFVLFTKFFYDVYFKGPDKKKKAALTEPSKTSAPSSQEPEIPPASVEDSEIYSAGLVAKKQD